MERVKTYALHEDFIARLADYLEAEIKQGRDINSLGIVFPGKRPALFLKRELARRIKKPFFPPVFFSIDEFIEYVLAKNQIVQKITDLDACFMIYELARKVSPDILKRRESFAAFLPWAREIFKFIEQLDLEGVTDEPLVNIQNKAAIGYDVPESINLLLKDVIAIRKNFHRALSEKNSYSRGLIYLKASQSVKECKFQELREVIFAGFFYLHKTEEAIIKDLFERNLAKLIFQGDAAQWSVLEKLQQRMDISIQPEKEDKAECKLSIEAGLDAHSQAGLVRGVLKDIKQLDKTVVVLPRPENIITLLCEISGTVDDFNVSMGYPLKRSSMYSLFSQIFKAQETKKKEQYYSKDYLRLLTHPLVKNLRICAPPAATRVLVHKIEEVILGMEQTEIGGSLFIKLRDIEQLKDLYDLAMVTMKKMDIEASRDDLKAIVKELHTLFFRGFEGLGNFADFAQQLSCCLEALVEKSFLSNYPLNVKMAERVYAIQEQLSGAAFRNEPFAAHEIFRIFENSLEQELISFSGSPLKGLQILGLFETRSLNFDNVIIMDLNEAVLPSIKIYEPLIPREVMIGLGLNRLEKEEEIQRYQFRKLIAGAKNVHLVYQKSPDKEKSRFLEELIWEKELCAGRLDVLEVPVGSFRVNVLAKKLSIAKDKKICDYLRRREYSASSVNTYLQCPLQFYFRYVLGLDEKEELLDEPQGADVGTFIHELLEQEFRKFYNRKPVIDSKFTKEFLGALDEKFERDFARRMKSDSFLVREILHVRLQRFLENEAQRDVAKILSLEEDFKLSIPCNGNEFKFKGRIDRIDQLNEQSIVVLDYKSSAADLLPDDDAQRIERLGFERAALKKTIKSFQLPLYLLFAESVKEFQGKRVNAALYTIKDLEKNFGLRPLFKSEEKFAQKDKIMAVYLKALASLFMDILDPSVPFKADEENLRHCRHCPFFYLCR